MDYKAFAKSMRENKVTDEKGIILCSPDLWEEIAKIIVCALGGKQRKETLLSRVRFLTHKIRFNF